MLSAENAAELAEFAMLLEVCAKRKPPIQTNTER